MIVKTYHTVGVPHLTETAGLSKLSFIGWMGGDRPHSHTNIGLILFATMQVLNE